jgi:hypothetical protein
MGNEIGDPSGRIMGLRWVFMCQNCMFNGEFCAGTSMSAKHFVSGQHRVNIEEGRTLCDRRLTFQKTSCLLLPHTLGMCGQQPSIAVTVFEATAVSPGHSRSLPYGIEFVIA